MLSAFAKPESRHTVRNSLARISRQPEGRIRTTGKARPEFITGREA